jgi:general nucleoside transport system permease protein
MELSLVPLLLEAAVRAGTPILLVALGELLAERAGILNLGVEGMMLVGALTGFIVSQQSGEPWIGVLAAAMAGVMLSCVHAFLSISLHANQVGSGLALTIFSAGLSGLLGKPFVGVPAKGFAPIAVPWLADVPLLGRMFFQHDPLVYVAYLLVPGLWVLLYRTQPGLKVRAVGEHPRSADALGISVVVVRYSCVLAGGLAAGLGGAYLSLAYTQMWVDNMTAGRGWIALAMVIFGGWNPVRTALGAYLFGGVQALQLRLQAIGVTVPTYLLMMTPYAFTILALIIASASRARGHVGTPTALGRAYIRGE